MSDKIDLLPPDFPPDTLSTKDGRSIAADFWDEAGDPVRAAKIRASNTLNTIYAVSSGEYSDYSVNGVCEDEATAKAWAKAMNDGNERYEEFRAESFTFIPAGTAPFKVTEYQQTATLNDDGTVTAEREWQAMSDKIAAWKSGVWAGPNFAEINEGGDEPTAKGE